MVNKITTPPTQNEVIDKINELVDGKQDTLVSGTNIKTVGGTSLVGSGNVAFPTVDQTYSATSTNAQSGVAVASAIGNGTVTINQGGTPRGTFTMNQSSNLTIDLDGTSGVSAIAILNKNTASPYQTLGIWQGTEYQWQNGEVKTWYNWKTSETAMWTSGGSLPSSANWASVTYGDGKFVAVAYASNKSAYSTDGINWTASTLPSSAYWASVTYGDGKFVAVAYISNQAAYSTDGINWTASTLPSEARWRSVTYGDGKFVAVAQSSDKPAYSTDGINWTASTMPSSATWRSVTYGDGKFVAVAYSSSQAAYSSDGINWTETTLPSSANWASVTYGDGKFVAAAGSVDTTAIFTIQYDKCYTTDQTPTTSSTVYSEPNVTSSYTISSVTSGAITLSDNNTYYYNQSGNVQTYDTIGNSHPEYLCFIDGVGVKIGNTVIATNNSNNS